MQLSISLGQETLLLRSPMALPDVLIKLVSTSGPTGPSILAPSRSESRSVGSISLVCAFAALMLVMHRKMAIATLNLFIGLPGNNWSNYKP